MSDKTIEALRFMASKETWNMSLENQAVCSDAADRIEQLETDLAEQQSINEALEIVNGALREQLAEANRDLATAVWMRPDGELTTIPPNSEVKG
jgi:hypothetical protein